MFFTVPTHGWLRSACSPPRTFFIPTVSGIIDLLTEVRLIVSHHRGLHNFPVPFSEHLVPETHTTPKPGLESHLRLDTLSSRANASVKACNGRCPHG